MIRENTYKYWDYAPPAVVNTIWHKFSTYNFNQIFLI